MEIVFATVDLYSERDRMDNAMENRDRDMYTHER